ncbi:MAG: extracellular solute-binding protein [Thermoleophilia bacterium]
MKATRILTLIAAAAIILAAVIWRSGDSTPTDPGGTSGGGDAVTVTFAYSPEKRPLLEPLVDEFNRQGVQVAGRPVVVDASSVSSGDAATRIAAGRLEANLWSPSSSLWGQVVNYRADAKRAPERSPSLVRTPLVIAMWQPLAEALGWPKREIGWSDILREATSKRGWAAYGRPEWGRFKLGHTNPDYSTSGLSAVVAEYLFATGKAEGLLLKDVRAPTSRKTVQSIEQSIVHYGDTTLFFAEQMAANGPAYASAVAMEEVTLVDYNRRLAGNGPKLVALYPKEGTFFSDNPLFVIDAPWSSPEQREAATALSEWLREHVDADSAAELFFRPGDPTAAPGSALTGDEYIDLALPKRVLSAPDPEVLNAIQQAWRADRKPARVQIVLDISGSMNEERKLASAQRGLDRFLSLMQPQDEVGLTVFNGRVTEVSAPIPIRTGRATLRTAVGNQIADGDTAVYDATLAAATDVAASATDKRIGAVVVLTDGQDTASTIDRPALERQLDRLTGSEGEAVRVFTIAYGSDASDADLERIAQAGGGRAYIGDPDTIEAVYAQIASFF